MKRKNKKKKGPMGVLFDIMAVLTVLLGVGLLAYPTVADWYNQYHSTRLIAGYTEAVEGMTQADFDKMLADARAYNIDLLTRRNRFKPSEAELEAYNKILDVTGTGIMGYIEIPAMSTRLPIYHTTSEAVLQIAVGHLPGSSFPTGDKATHTALSGHSALPSAKLFTDLETLDTGDVFELHVLDKTQYYEIDAINVVLPENMDLLSIDQDAEQVTLITCTPYGVNTHRLLVRGNRIESPPDDYMAKYHPAEAGDIENPEPGDEGFKPSKAQVAVFIFLAVMVILIIIWIFWGHGGKAKSDVGDDGPADQDDGP